MDSERDALNWGQGFERYINASHILDSESWKEAQGKLDKLIDIGKRRGNRTIIYYDFDDNTLWNEYKFLFLCQFLEFRLAELFFKLNEEKKIKQEFISKLRSHKGANPERAAAKGNERILSPASLISDLGGTLGKLINNLDRFSHDFKNKKELLHMLNDFNKHRISFVHHSFNTNKMAEDFNLKDIIMIGMKLGKEVLKSL